MRRPRASDRMYVDRRTAVGLFAAGCLFPLKVRGEERARRIAILRGADRATYATMDAKFQTALQSYGWIAGGNLIVDQRYAYGNYDHLSDLVDEVVSSNPDIIVVGGTSLADAVMKGTKDIPVIFEFVSDPVKRGYAQSLAKPGGNATGTTASVINLIPKRLDILQMLRPRLATIGYLIAGPITSAITLPILEAAAQERGFEIRVRRVRAREEIEQAFAAAVAGKDDALLVEWTNFTALHKYAISAAEKQSRIPCLYEVRGHVEAGGLISYGSDPAVLHARSAFYIDKILRGASPGDLPVEQPTKFELVINLRTAGQIDLQISPALLALADEVIE